VGAAGHRSRGDHVSAFRTCARENHGNAAPFHTPQDEGPFSFTRNPIYLANTMLMVSAGLIEKRGSFVGDCGVSHQKLAIERGRHLEVRFGKIPDYAKRVRRWI
jgi:protein-S-isoprenylcysteine O-methyltransferase Ste14